MFRFLMKYVVVFIIFYYNTNIVYNVHASNCTSCTLSIQEVDLSHSYVKPEVHQYLIKKSENFRHKSLTNHSKIVQMIPDVVTLQKLSKADIQQIYLSDNQRDKDFVPDKQFLHRKTNWYQKFDGASYDIDYFANPGSEIDQWAQAYRMLGGFIDCDHSKGDSNDSGDGEKDGCSRWMMWAAYYNPNYSGGGRSEYFNDNDDDFTNFDGGKYYSRVETNEPKSRLDCHSSETEWILIGVYRQEFYQFLEQISKHLWAIDEYEYVVALSGLAYMTDADCWQVGNANDGTTLYAGIEPLSGGNFQISLYSDSSCLYPRYDLDLTFDDFGLTSSMVLSSGDEGNDDGYDDDVYSALYEYWQQAQEYTLGLVNEVYDKYKYCTLCMDYPTYQDGYFNGNDGTEDNDLINQCWKFHSHDSFVCESDCLALADSQGTILEIKYGGTFFGRAWDDSTVDIFDTRYNHNKWDYRSNKNRPKLQRLKANAFLCFSTILFFATFLAFAVTKGPRDSQSCDDEKSKSLLSNEINPHQEITSNRRGRSRKKESNQNCLGIDLDMKSPNHLPKRKRNTRRIKLKNSIHSEQILSNSSMNSLKSNSRRRLREIDDF